MKQSLHVTIFGAAGNIGQLLVHESLARGWTVTAFVHRHHNLPKNDRLTIVQGDIYNPSDVDLALKHADVVLSALSSWGTPKKDVLTSAMSAIIPAMHRRKIARIISLTGAEARANGDELSLIHRLAHFGIVIIGKKVLQDGERHIALLESSNLDWTVIRSPIMSSQDDDHYHLVSKRPMPWAFINRRAVAAAMIDAVIDDRTIKRAPFITR